MKIRRLNESFEEHEVTWESYTQNDDLLEAENSVEFDVHRDHVGKSGKIDISRLIKPSENHLIVAIHVGNGGHVKVASKENKNVRLIPHLLLSNMEEL